MCVANFCAVGKPCQKEQEAKYYCLSCSRGEALLVLTKAFPASTFHRYDTSARVLEVAEKNKVAKGLQNVVF